jgi:hypothetical protein
MYIVGVFYSEHSGKLQSSTTCTCNFFEKYPNTSKTKSYEHFNVFIKKLCSLNNVSLKV